MSSSCDVAVKLKSFLHFHSELSMLAGSEVSLPVWGFVLAQLGLRTS